MFDKSLAILQYIFSFTIHYVVKIRNKCKPALFAIINALFY